MWKQNNPARLPTKVRCWSPYHCVLRFFHPICRKYCACYSKVRPGRGTWPPNMSAGGVSFTCRANWSNCRSFFLIAPRLWSLLKVSQSPHVWQKSIAPAGKNEAWTPKSGPNMWCVSCAWRQSRVHFLDAHPAWWFRAGRFSENPSFDPRNHKTLEEHTLLSSFYLLSLLWLFPRLLLHVSLKRKFDF